MPIQTNSQEEGKCRWNGEQCYTGDQQTTEFHKAAKVEVKFWL